MVHRAMRTSSVRAAVAALCLLALLAPSVSAQSGGSVAVGKKKTLIETIHFGDFYLPGLIATGPYLHAFYRPKEQNGLDRMVATSKNGGKKFGKKKRVRIPGLTNLLSMTGDGTGTSYFVGTYGDGTLSVLRADAKLKTFAPSNIIDLNGGIVAASLAIGTEGRIFLVMQRKLSVFTQSGQTLSDQIYWSVSTDGGATFSAPTLNYDRPYEFAEYHPSLVAGSDGAVWLVFARDDTNARAAGGDAFNAGRLFVKRLLPVASEMIEISRGPANGRIYSLQAEAAPGGVRVAWSELAVDTPELLERVYFSRFDEGTAPTTPTAALLTVAFPHFPHMARTDDGQIVVFAHGAGFDSNQPEPAIIAVGSVDDGLTFGPVTQVTGYPPITSFWVARSSSTIFGLWTDTRVVQFASFSAKPAS
jgi:hypothetical protein